MDLTMPPDENIAIEFAAKEAAAYHRRVLRREQGELRAKELWPSVVEAVVTQCEEIAKAPRFPWRWSASQPPGKLRVDTGRGVWIELARVEGDIEVCCFDGTANKAVIGRFSVYPAAYPSSTRWEWRASENGPAFTPRQVAATVLSDLLQRDIEKVKQEEAPPKPPPDFSPISRARFAHLKFDPPAVAERKDSL